MYLGRNPNGPDAGLNLVRTQRQWHDSLQVYDVAGEAFVLGRRRGGGIEFFADIAAEVLGARLHDARLTRYVVDQLSQCVPRSSRLDTQKLSYLGEVDLPP
ncbi:hypothetical protein, partial [Arthrobacter sp. H5]|uniref:hypothetical protein n=1 Tax=Arthrobacter sp. H5 TaxID=1267973 RepID=UPI0020A6796A